MKCLIDVVVFIFYLFFYFLIFFLKCNRISYCCWRASAVETSTNKLCLKFQQMSNFTLTCKLKKNIFPCLRKYLPTTISVGLFNYQICMEFSRHIWKCLQDLISHDNKRLLKLIDKECTKKFNIINFILCLIIYNKYWQLRCTIFLQYYTNCIKNK